jgi:hypothetical protein
MVSEATEKMSCVNGVQRRLDAKPTGVRWGGVPSGGPAAAVVLGSVKHNAQYDRDRED